MGSGKTTVGNVLANKINLKFKDLDLEIEKSENLSIAEIFDKKGEIYFRKLEMQKVKELIESKESFVLASGGGTPCYGETMKRMLTAEDSVVVYLRGNVNYLKKRLKNEKEKRPVLAHLNSDEQLSEWIGAHLFERSQFYNRAHHIVGIDAKTVEEIADEIIEKITLK